MIEIVFEFMLGSIPSALFDGFIAYLNGMKDTK